MQVVDCYVAIGGDVRTVVFKQNVTIPELVILQAIHGRESIKHVKVTGEVRNFNPVAERERLIATYQITERSPNVMQFFPGVRPSMPTRLEDVVLTDPDPNDVNASAGALQVVRFDEGGGKAAAQGDQAQQPEPVSEPDEDVGELEEPLGVEVEIDAEVTPEAAQAPSTETTGLAIFD